MNHRSENWIVIFVTISISVIVLSPMFSGTAGAVASSGKIDLNPSSVPKFVHQLSGPPPVFVPTKTVDPSSGQMTDYYSIIETETYQQILPAYDSAGRPTGLKSTEVWSYGGLAKDALTGEVLGWVRGTPAATIEATRGVPVNVAWVNGIITPVANVVDQTLDPNDPAGSSLNTTADIGLGTTSGTALFPVTTTTHLQGAETPAQYSGVPYSWVSWNGLHGSDYSTYARTVPNGAVYHYDNEQAPGTLWFRDRAVGLTRSNVYSGLSGFYMLRDPADPIAELLPSGKYEMPLSIQDRNFYTDGSLKLPSAPMDITASSAWLAEYYGNVMTVNGKAWPNMNVDRGQYLFKILDGSDARWYDLSMSNGMSFRVIAADENYLSSPVTMTSLTIAPGERYDILVDFGGYPAGTEIFLTNKASAPYDSTPSPLTPNNGDGGMGTGGAGTGDQSASGSNGAIMKFTVGGQNGFISKTLPEELNPKVGFGYDLSTVSTERTFTLIDYTGQVGNSALLDGKVYKTPVSELPKAGSTEIWRIVDATKETHQIHLDLVNMLVVSRQDFALNDYRTDWLAANGGSLPISNQTNNIEMQKYLLGTPSGPTPIERGLKDSIRVDPGEVVTIVVHFAPADGSATYPFDPSTGPRYIWNSNIFDHEMNEMMRQFSIVA